MDTTNISLPLIGNTIKAVAHSEAARYFKTELADNLDDGALVFGAITGAVWVALKRLGLSMEQVLEQIDADDMIIAAMMQVGYRFPEDVVTPQEAQFNVFKSIIDMYGLN